MSKNRVIGKDGKLPWNFRADLTLFKDLFYHATVLMGRKAFEDFGHQIEAKRLLVVSHAALTLSAALSACQDDPAVYILGGQSIYEQTIHLVDGIYALERETTMSGDAFYPDIYGQEFKVRSRERVQDLPTKLYMTFYKRVWDEGGPKTGSHDKPEHGGNKELFGTGTEGPVGWLPFHAQDKPFKIWEATE